MQHIVLGFAFFPGQIGAAAAVVVVLLLFHFRETDEDVGDAFAVVVAYNKEMMSLRPSSSQRRFVSSSF